MSDGMATTAIEGGTAARCPYAVDADMATAGRQDNAPPDDGMATRPALDPETRLALPDAKKIVRHYREDAAGNPELTLYYGDKEISFDEPHLFPFAEMLSLQSHFRAGDAVGWAPGLRWAEISPLLAQLVSEEILLADAHAGAIASAPAGLTDRARPSPLPPARCTIMADWRDCATLTRDLTGIAVDPGHLEMLIPVFRVAHIAVDGDGRQVGEANVFPRALRRDIATEWLTCTYAGTRYLSERPMNATALRSMRGHWRQIMAALVTLRRAFLQRFPHIKGPLTVGDVERLAVLVLAVPTYALVKADAPVASGDLHPALSSLFRVTDGVRMVMHQMLFVPIGEPALPPDTPVNAATVHAYAERNYAFHSETGVCAGPRVLVEEFLRVLIDGAVPDGADGFAFDPEVAAALADREAAFDYGLAGLQIHAAVFSIWPAMATAYSQLGPALADSVAAGAVGLQPAQDRIAAADRAVRETTYLATEAWRAQRDIVYADMFARCAAASRRSETAGNLCQPDADLRTTRQAMTATLADALAVATGNTPAALQPIAACLATFCARMQSLLATANICQDQLNAMIGRAPASTAFGSRELDVHNLLQGATARRVPYIFDEIEAVFGLRIRVTPVAMEIDVMTSPLPLACRQADHAPSAQ